ncbi:type II toxin-antitoxin system VapC family toxin, partial [Rhizobium ruizarguesonis]
GFTPPFGARTAGRGLANSTWGKGAHPASLNFGDCFAYEVAREHGCRLLFVGDDIVMTDVESAL